MDQLTIPDEIYTRILRFFELDEDLIIAASILGPKPAFPVIFSKIKITKKKYINLFKVVTKKGQVLISPSSSGFMMVVIDDFDEQNSKADSHQLCFLKPYITNVMWYVEGRVEGPETEILNSFPNLKSVCSNLKVNNVNVEFLDVYSFRPEWSQVGDNIQSSTLTRPEADNEEQTGYFAINSRKFPKLRKLKADNITIRFTGIMPQLRTLSLNRACKGLDNLPNLQELVILFETPYEEEPEFLANIPDKLKCLCLKKVETPTFSLSLEGMSELETLNFDQCSFSELLIAGDSIQSVILDYVKYKCLLIRCPSLEELELIGIYAQTFGSNLENCNQLESLKMFTNEIKTLQLPILENLKKLEMANLEIEVMKGLDLPKVEIILASRCKIGLVEEFNCPSLREFSFRDGGLKAISFLKNCNNIETLDLMGNEISDLSETSFPDSLKNLNLGRNTFKKLQNLNNLNNLIDLNVSHDTDLYETEKLSKNIPLETLTIDYTKVKSLKPFEDLAKLVGLSAVCCSLQKIERLSLSELMVLNLGLNDITKIENLEPLCFLRELALSRTRIAKLENLRSLTCLETLRLDNTKIQVIDGDELRGLKNLTYLNLLASEVEEVINFHNLPLVILLLEANRITHVGGIHDMLNLRVLSLGNNSISEIDEEFRNFPNLELLTLFDNTLEDDFKFDADARGINKQVTVELESEEPNFSDEYEYED